MKSFSIILSLLSVIVTLAGCTKTQLPSVALSSDKDAIQVDAYTNSVAFTLSWECTGGSADIKQTYVQFSAEKEFLDPYILRSSSQSFIVTYKDLKNMHGTFGVVDNYDLYVRLLIEGENVPAVYSNKLKIPVTLNK